MTVTDPAEIPIRATGLPPVAFSIAVESRSEVAQLSPKGELDLATVGQLQRELGRLIGAGFGQIVIDLRGVEFLDSTGLHAVLTAHAKAQHGNWALTVIPGPRAVQRIFEITGTIDRLPFAAATERVPIP